MSGTVGKNQEPEQAHNTENEIILEVKDLRKYYPVHGGYFFKRKLADIKAVDGVSFAVRKGETLGLVGESGCGKSTIARTITFLYKPTSGEIHFKGVDLRGLTKSQIRKNAKNLTMVFQDPGASIDPRFSVLQTILEPLEIHDLIDEREKYGIVRDLLIRVGLSPHHAYRYPHELSGGQQQRVGIARALTLQPDLIILDEPVSALDVSVRASIINLLIQLQDDFNFTYVFIAHDLSVIRKISHNVAVMYLGKIVEYGNVETIFNRPSHPYTQALISAIPVPDPESKREIIRLKGEVPTPINPPSGCRFCTRCRFVRQKCFLEEPILRELTVDKSKSGSKKSQNSFKNKRQVACHYAEAINDGSHKLAEELADEL